MLALESVLALHMVVVMMLAYFLIFVVACRVMHIRGCKAKLLPGV